MNGEPTAALANEIDLPLSSVGLRHQGEGRLLGDILREQMQLPAQAVPRILEHAALRGLRFGDAAVALGHASAPQVLRALAAQFADVRGADDALSQEAELPMLSRPHSLQAEALRAIRGQLVRRQARAGGAQPPLAVVSPRPQDGKTFLTANLGIALAQAGSRTLLLDADMRGPRLHEIFRLRGTQGLTDALIGRCDGLPIRAVPTVPGLYVMPCGAVPPNPAELLERDVFATLLAGLRRHFDRVLVDSPAVLHGPDAYTLAHRCGSSLLVGRRHHTAMGELRRVAGELGQDGQGPVGVIVNEF